MQISVQRDTYPGHRRSPWLVVVPRRLSSSGKRVYRRFATKAAAGAFAGSIRNAVRAQGEHPIAPLTLEQTAEVHRAQRALEGSGLSLLQAAQLVQQLLQQHGSVASLLSLGEQGRGETPQFYRVVNHPRHNILYLVRRYSNATHSTHPVRLSLMRCTR